MSDPAEPIRRQRLAEINTAPGSRGALEAKYGQVWDTHQLAEEFDVIGFLAPLVVVRRKVDGIKGSWNFNISLGSTLISGPTGDRSDRSTEEENRT